MTRRVKVKYVGRGKNEGRKGVKIGEEESWLDALPPCIHVLLSSASIGVTPAFFKEGREEERKRERERNVARPVERRVEEELRVLLQLCIYIYIYTYRRLRRKIAARRLPLG